MASIKSDLQLTQSDLCSGHQSHGLGVIFPEYFPSSCVTLSANKTASTSIRAPSPQSGPETSEAVLPRCSSGKSANQVLVPVLAGAPPRSSRAPPEADAPAFSCGLRARAWPEAVRDARCGSRIRRGEGGKKRKKNPAA